MRDGAADSIQALEFIRNEAQLGLWREKGVPGEILFLKRQGSLNTHYQIKQGEDWGESSGLYWPQESWQIRRHYRL